MKLKQYQVDAFAERVFEGNPAAVCPLDHWLDDGLLQAIANENNLSETAFFVPAEKGFQLRWFTPWPKSTSADTQRSPQRTFSLTSSATPGSRSFFRP